MPNAIIFSGGGTSSAYAAGCITRLPFAAHRRVDEVCGASAGAIIAALFIMGFSADSMLEILDETVKTAFKGNWNPLGGIIGAKYSADDLREALKPYIPDTRRVDDFGRQRLLIGITQLDPVDAIAAPGHWSLLQAVVTSCLAPSYFPIEDYADGGLVANTPLHLVSPTARVLALRAGPELPEGYDFLPFTPLTDRKQWVELAIDAQWSWQKPLFRGEIRDHSYHTDADLADVTVARSSFEDGVKEADAVAFNFAWMMEHYGRR